MFITKLSKHEIRQRALFEAIRFCGGIAAYARLLKISRSTASYWLNKGSNIPYGFVILTEAFTGVSIERLSPFTEELNKATRRCASGQSPYVNGELNDILIKKQAYVKHLKPDRPIIVGTDGILVSGLAQMEIYKTAGIKKSQIMILDLEVLLLKTRAITDLNIHLLLISEQIAIGLRLEQLLGTYQGQRNDLTILSEKNNPSLISKWGYVKGRRDIKVAEIMGYSTTTYYRAKQVYLHGTPELIDAMDRDEISIAMAAKKVRTNPVQENCFLTTLGGM